MAGRGPAQADRPRLVKLIWTRSATVNRKQIREYIAQENLAAALTLDDLFSKRAILLAKHHGAGRPGRVAGTRELVIHPNYIMIYQVAGDTVRILRLLHAARQWPSRR
ncbi:MULTISPECIES: type II toxin-antitoxin system RelE/ParE family toxin [Nitrospirillum]|uniref:type II toxin-antitoxin system RelE/ParE family toxin n=1 Tax=Nitrospirillum amazonense TaxID=28077 RepID=UPI00164784E2|nr:type II toxin-antitoxin system RelE/ParE family toxin [Nitrospirillum amazonense]MEC4592963.1 type II toxin-antitoxin system RelE/ParE family toxin [Nitrospirillum amazonense]